MPRWRVELGPGCLIGEGLGVPGTAWQGASTPRNVLAAVTA
jgi:hypothetical protein